MNAQLDNAQIPLKWRSWQQTWSIAFPSCIAKCSPSITRKRRRSNWCELTILSRSVLTLTTVACVKQDDMVSRDLPHIMPGDRNKVFNFLMRELPFNYPSNKKIREQEFTARSAIALAAR